jgi:hypothetical protein
MATDQIQRAIDSITAQAVDASTCEEFEEEYRLAKRTALEHLGRALEARMKYDGEQAELARYRAAEAERTAREAADRAVREEKEAEERRAAETKERFARERRASIDLIKADANVEFMSAAGIKKRLQNVLEREFPADRWGDFLVEAIAANGSVLLSLRVSLADAERKEAEVAAEQQRQRAAAAALEAEVAAQAAERRRLEDEARKRREADEAAASAARIAEAKKKAEEEAERDRALDVEHRKKVNRAAAAALALLMPGGGAHGNIDLAQEVLTAIIRGKVPHVSVTY